MPRPRLPLKEPLSLVGSASKSSTLICQMCLHSTRTGQMCALCEERKDAKKANFTTQT